MINLSFALCALRTSVLCAALALATFLPSAARADEAVWSQLRNGGFVVFIRHALTDPGVGDPPGFRIDDCSTQRNLNAVGRAEAQRLATAFRRHAVPVAQVLTSEWCRCKETAQIAFGRYDEVWPALNNLFGRQENAAPQRRAMLERASRFGGPGNLVLMTHGITIAAVAGINPATAEMVVMKPVAPGKLELVGRIPVTPE